MKDVENDRRNDLTEMNLLNIAKIQKIARKKSGLHSIEEFSNRAPV
jgi:hypothetical protein